MSESGCLWRLSSWIGALLVEMVVAAGLLLLVVGEGVTVVVVVTGT